ncbi:hypothetical protein ABE41_003445 [Fictibacillus arsenicus]|uniref:Uncharacterized protein n=1 Tax=Fictibacillus arsenicus TaxID=255247 RepID=A0A1B1Z0R3_9BACL|nr:hypothetical protein ABE41_003445 [Fictibacillus arsenicus]
MLSNQLVNEVNGKKSKSNNLFREQPFYILQKKSSLFVQMKIKKHTTRRRYALITIKKHTSRLE